MAKIQMSCDVEHLPQTARSRQKVNGTTAVVILMSYHFLDDIFLIETSSLEGSKLFVGVVDKLGRLLE
jgi:hypothetical protein